MIEVVRRIHEILLSRTVVATNALADELNVSMRTVQRRLTRLSCRRSYSHNARYVALAESTCFDEYGVWQYEGICFSRYGNLTNTVAGLVDASSAGLTNRELTERIRLNARSFVSQFSRRGLIVAQKLDARLRYFSADPSRAAVQRAAFQATTDKDKDPRISDSVAVKLLLAWINIPAAKPEDLAAVLWKQGCSVTADSVVDFLRSHDLLKKKNGSELTRQAVEANPSLADLLRELPRRLQGTNGRRFMAEVVSSLGAGAQRWAETTLGWNRVTIRKGTRELTMGRTEDNRMHLRGRKPITHKLPDIEEDIKKLVDPQVQQEYTFHTTRVFRRITAQSVRDALIESGKYTDPMLPCVRTICGMLTDLGYPPVKVVKSKPRKKIPQTDAIFDEVHRINAEADETPGVLRLSIDAKAAIKVGPFSRGGRNRRQQKACDHDFAPTCILQLVGINLPAHAENNFYFNESRTTADFIVDSIEDLWPKLQSRYAPINRLVLNLDNGPENHSRRTQFVKRLVDFVDSERISITMAYYPPYHSKYNPIERVWGVLEEYWSGDLLDSREKVLGMAGSMKWRGCHPYVNVSTATYQKGVKLTPPEMAQYEKRLTRKRGLEPWSVEIQPN